MHDGWDVDLNLQVEHVIRCDTFGDLKEILLSATVEIIDQEATRVPVVLCPVEHFELDKSCLTSLHRGVVLILRAVRLLWHMLNVCQVLDIDSFLGSEDVREPVAPVLLGWNASKLDIVLEAHHVLLFLFYEASLAFLLLYPRLLFVLLGGFLRVFHVWLIVVQLDQILLSQLPFDRSFREL